MKRNGDHIGVGIISGSIWGSFQGWASFRGRDHFGGCTDPPFAVLIYLVFGTVTDFAHDVSHRVCFA